MYLDYFSTTKNQFIDSVTMPFFKKLFRKKEHKAPDIVLDSTNAAIVELLREHYPNSLSYPHFDRLIGMRVENTHSAHPSVGDRIAYLREINSIETDRMKLTSEGLKFAMLAQLKARQASNK